MSLGRRRRSQPSACAAALSFVSAVTLRLRSRRPQLLRLRPCVADGPTFTRPAAPPQRQRGPATASLRVSSGRHLNPGHGRHLSAATRPPHPCTPWRSAARTPARPPRARCARAPPARSCGTRRLRLTDEPVPLYAIHRCRRPACCGDDLCGRFCCVYGRQRHRCCGRQCLRGLAGTSSPGVARWLGRRRCGERGLPSNA